jgi:hypothetical protein
VTEQDYFKYLKTDTLESHPIEDETDDFYSASIEADTMFDSLYFQNLVEASAEKPMFDIGKWFPYLKQDGEVLISDSRYDPEWLDLMEQKGTPYLGFSNIALMNMPTLMSDRVPNVVLQNMDMFAKPHDILAISIPIPESKMN